MDESRVVARRADDLVRCCYSGLRGRALQTEVVRAIHACFPWTPSFSPLRTPGRCCSPASSPRSHWSALLISSSPTSSSENDVNKFQSLAAGAQPRSDTRLRHARRSRAGSARYRDIIAPLGLGDELRAALVTPSGCWGYLCLHRAESPYGFTPAEVRLIGRLAASLGNGFRLSLAAPVSGADDAIAPGVVVLHPDHTLAAITGEAERLLAEIADYSPTQGVFRPPSTLQLPACKASIVARRRLGASPTVRVRTSQRRLATRSRDPSAWHGR